MAEYAMIDGYLDTMRGKIRWRKDLDDVVSEMEDHLYSTVEGLLATGADPHDAQRTTLDRFGEPTVLAAVYASTPRGGLAVPTQKTRRAGTLALVGGGLWLAAGVPYLLMVLGGDNDSLGVGWQTYYAIFSALVLAAGVLTVLAMLGVARRAGGLGTAGTVAIVIAGLGVLASVIAWAVPFWMAIQAAGYIIFGLALTRTGVAPNWTTFTVAAGFPLGIATFVTLTAMKVGPVDEWGDYPVAWGVGGIVGTTILAIGVLGWAMWLREEEPVDIDSDAVPA